MAATMISNSMREKRDDADHMEPPKIHSFIHILTVDMLTEKMNELKKISQRCGIQFDVLNLHITNRTLFPLACSYECDFHCHIKIFSHYENLLPRTIKNYFLFYFLSFCYSFLLDAVSLN